MINDSNPDDIVVTVSVEGERYQLTLSPQQFSMLKTLIGGISYDAAHEIITRDLGGNRGSTIQEVTGMIDYVYNSLAFRI